MVTRIYVGERGVPEGVGSALEAAGFQVERGEAPRDADAGDFSLVPATEGVTSSLRHALGNHLTVILGYGEILLRHPELPAELRGRAAAIREGARACREVLRRSEAGPR